jgi:hypothetical protein
VDASPVDPVRLEVQRCARLGLRSRVRLGEAHRSTVLDAPTCFESRRDEQFCARRAAEPLTRLGRTIMVVSHGVRWCTCTSR